MITEDTADRIWHRGSAVLLLERTCHACPEQYDVWLPDGHKIGYLRLRHGYFYVEAYLPGDSEPLHVYEAEPEGDGIFASEDERERHLAEACAAIMGVFRLRLLGEVKERLSGSAQ